MKTRASILTIAVFITFHYSCKLKKKSDERNLFSIHTFSIHKFCNLTNTDDDLNCIDYCEDETSITVTLDSDGIHFLTYIHDENIQASMTTRDTTLYKESCFEIFFDPLADGLDYYEIEINAQGTIYDYILKDSDNPLNAPENMVSWHIPDENLTIRIDGTINDHNDKDVGWGFKLFIPWEIVHEGRPNKDECLAYNFMRVDANDFDPAKYWVAQPTGRRSIHVPETWPKLCF